MRRYSFFIHVSQTHELGASAMAHQFPFSIILIPKSKVDSCFVGAVQTQQVTQVVNKFTKGLDILTN